MLLNKGKNPAAGFTLIELMIAMVIASLISAAMYAMFQAQVRGQVSQDVSLQMTQNLREAMAIMTHDIRMAGCDPTQNANAVVLLADDNELHITMDIGGGVVGQPDGDTDDPGEDVRYAVNPAGNLGRDVAGAEDDDDLQTLALNCNALNFVYLAPDNTNIPADADVLPDVLPTPVTADNLNNIIAIQVSIVVGAVADESENPLFLRPATDNTSYRNLQNTEILAPQGDTVRRFQLSETIDCRNL